MRIALVVNNLGRGGAERQAALWAEVCANLGHEPVIAVLDPVSREYEVPRSVEVAQLGKSRRTDLPRLVRRLRKVVRDGDLAIAFQTYPALCCALAVRLPWLVVAGNDPRHWRDTSRVPAALFRWAFSRAALGCAPTLGISECHEQLGVRTRRGWRVVPNIVAGEAFVEPKREKKGVLFVGRLVPEKNPQLAVDAAAAAGARLTIAGEGSLEPMLRRWLLERGDGAGVELCGFVERPWRLYARHRVLLVTSSYELFGNVIVESLAAGTPVVSVDCDFGPRELIGRASYSHLADPDPQSLSRLLRVVLERPYTGAERRECLDTAARYRQEAVAPIIGNAIEEAVR